jgi:hypothetical protein
MSEALSAAVLLELKLPVTPTPGSHVPCSSAADSVTPAVVASLSRLVASRDTGNIFNNALRGVSSSSKLPEVGCAGGALRAVESHRLLLEVANGPTLNLLGRSDHPMAGCITVVGVLVTTAAPAAAASDRVNPTQPGRRCIDDIVRAKRGLTQTPILLVPTLTLARAAQRNPTLPTNLFDLDCLQLVDFWTDELSDQPSLHARGGG